MVAASNISVKKLTLAGLCLALTLLLPFLTGQIPQVGNMLCPMHIPVLLCGFLCGWPLAAIVGFAAPLLRFLLFSMPPIFPTGLAMAFELCAYGFASGWLYARLPGKTLHVYRSLLGAMLFGRVVWGAAMTVILGLSGSALTWAVFFAEAFLNALPGIVLHILLIPPIVISLKKAKLLPYEG